MTNNILKVVIELLLLTVLILLQIYFIDDIRAVTDNDIVYGYYIIRFYYFVMGLLSVFLVYNIASLINNAYRSKYVPNNANLVNIEIKFDPDKFELIEYLLEVKVLKDISSILPEGSDLIVTYLKEEEDEEHN